MSSVNEQDTNSDDDSTPYGVYSLRLPSKLLDRLRERATKGGRVRDSIVKSPDGYISFQIDATNHDVPCGGIFGMLPATNMEKELFTLRRDADGSVTSLNFMGGVNGKLQNLGATSSMSADAAALAAAAVAAADRKQKKKRSITSLDEETTAQLLPQSAPATATSRPQQAASSRSAAQPQTGVEPHTLRPRFNEEARWLVVDGISSAVTVMDVKRFFQDFVIIQEAVFCLGRCCNNNHDPAGHSDYMSIYVSFQSVAGAEVALLQDKEVLVLDRRKGGGGRKSSSAVVTFRLRRVDAEELYWALAVGLPIGAQDHSAQLRAHAELMDVVLGTRTSWDDGRGGNWPWYLNNVLGSAPIEKESLSLGANGALVLHDTDCTGGLLHQMTKMEGGLLRKTIVAQLLRLRHTLGVHLTTVEQEDVAVGNISSSEFRLPSVLFDVCTRFLAAVLRVTDNASRQRA